jgi:hypothetical protein
MVLELFNGASLVRQKISWQGFPYVLTDESLGSVV